MVIDQVSQRAMNETDPEDILSTSLETLYQYAPITHSTPGSLYTYTIKPSWHDLLKSNSSCSVTLKTPDTRAENWSLHASSIWVSSLFIADHLEDLQLGRRRYREGLRVLELGAGAGLPSILISKVYQDALVTVSDYPDDSLIQTLSENVEWNDVSDRCRVVPYAWGTDISRLISNNRTPGYEDDKHLFDIIIAADTLWNPESHGSFIETLRTCLRKAPDSRIHLVAGLHTGRYTVQAFFNTVEQGGFVIESAIEKEVSGVLQRSWSVAQAESEDEKERRRWVIWAVLKWKI